MIEEVDEEERRIFGIPAVLTANERATLQRDLTLLWEQTYERKLGALASDLERGRRFFDPLARGLTLRERLTELSPPPTDVSRRMERYGEPLVVQAGEGLLLVGVEARLTIELLKRVRSDREHIVIPPSAASWAEHTAMETYRKWALSRLRQVIDLRSGAGKEVMQAVAVGIVLALLVNRSDCPQRAVEQREHSTPDGRDVDRAIYAGADRFAEVLTAKSSRSSAEHRLKGGYGLTEARRRLAHRLIVADDASAKGVQLIYIPAEYRNEVISFLAKDLARRSNLTAATLERAFDQLVSEFRAYARNLAYRSMVFERPADTSELRNRLLAEFITNKSLK
jgi:hypothetical protein